MRKSGLLLAALLPVSGLAIEYPAIKDPTHASMLERYKADRAKIEAEGFFTPPAANASTDCSMSEIELYQLAGLDQAHSDLRGKFDKNARRFYRSAGVPGVKMKWENVKFIVTEMPCANGVPNGIVKAFNSFDLISDSTNTTTTGTSTSTMSVHTISQTSRWLVREVKNGVIQDDYAMYTHQSTVSETHWSDPATEKAMQNVSKDAGTNRPLVSIGADYRTGNGNSLKVASLYLMKDQPDIASMSGGKIKKFKDVLMSTYITGIDDLRSVSQMYSDALLQLISHTKDGALHGEWLTYQEDVYKKMGIDWRTMAGMENVREVNVDGRVLLENRMCYQNNEMVKMSPCPSE